jgi:2-hydroxy-3-keto-5-methylthiopentenyl-1-phosphate phosphatase
MRVKRPLLIFSDFDSTITKKDACSKIPNLKEQKNWETVSTLYSKHFEENLERNFLNLNPLETKKEIQKLILEFSKQMDDSESFGISKLEEYEILKGIQKNEIFKLGFETEQMEDFPNFIKFVEKLSIPFNIVSSNWSFDLICGNLKKNEILPKFYTEPDGKFVIFSNDLEFDNHLSTGMLSFQNAVCSTGKLNFVKETKKKFENFQCMYIGDDWVDLNCLLSDEIQFPIVINPTKMMKKILNQTQSEKFVNIVSSWHEIQQIIEKIE